jgi:HK97 family phage major capsid protein
MSKFVEKSAAELEALSPVELQSYYMAKMDAENVRLNEKMSALEVELKEAKDAEAVKGLNAQVEALKEAQKESGIVLKKVKETVEAAQTVRNVEGSIEAILAEKSSDFAMAKTKRHDFNFALDTKAVGDMTFAANLSGGNMPQAQRLEGINDIVEREARVYGRVPKLSVSGNTVDWVYETAQEGAAAGTAEGAAKNQIDNNFVVTSVSLLKQTAYFKVSTEMLDDVAFMASWLRNKLIVRLFNRIDSQVIEGDGTGTNLNGLVTQATAFAAGSFALAVDNANDVDVLVVAANQIRTAEHMGALTILMHPDDVTGLKLEKLSSSDKRYVERLAQVGASLTMDGIPIVETTAITAGTYLIGDMSKALIAEKGSIMVEVGLDGNDFTNNMRTIIGEWRGEVIIQNNDTTAFVTGTFSTDKTALETT